MSDRLLQLASALQQKQGIIADPGEEKIEVSLPARSAATLYEKARSAIDYQEEHLLRRNAILRIVKRYAGSESTIAEISENLIRELIWARYLPNKEVPARLVAQLIPIFEKYEIVIRSLQDYDESESGRLYDWLMDVLATELEYAITPPIHNEALASFMYDEMKDRVEWDRRLTLTDEQKDLFTYIAVHRSLLKSDDATLRFRIFTLYYPEWPGEAPKDLTKHIVSHLASIVETVDGYIDHSVSDRLARLMRRPAGLFRAIYAAFEEEPEKMVSAVNDPEQMDSEIKKSLKKLTKQFRSVSRRTVLRSILFLFITKTLMALAIEVPYELIFLDERHYVPVIVNIVFPPFLLGMIALTVSINERKNTGDYVECMRAVLTGASHELLNVRIKRRRRNGWTVMFNLLYAITYLFVFGFIASVLTAFHFSWVSISIFIFVLCLVAFFGIRIRNAVKDIVISAKRQGLMGSLFDLITIPVLNAGRWLSTTVSKVNIFVYFFDFILEAPFKVAVRFFEGWTDYIKEKREEL
jgi:hypothetical protein